MRITPVKIIRGVLQANTWGGKQYCRLQRFTSVHLVRQHHQQWRSLRGDGQLLHPGLIEIDKRINKKRIENITFRGNSNRNILASHIFLCCWSVKACKSTLVHLRLFVFLFLKKKKAERCVRVRCPPRWSPVKAHWQHWHLEHGEHFATSRSSAASQVHWVDR